MCAHVYVVKHVVISVFGTLGAVSHSVDTVNLRQLGKARGCGNVDEHCAEGNQHV